MYKYGNCGREPYIYFGNCGREPYMYIHGNCCREPYIYTVIVAGKAPNERSYAVHIQTVLAGPSNV